MTEWHKYPDELPEDGTWNLFRVEGSSAIATPPAIVAFFEDNEIVGLVFYRIWRDQITHWMPLPEFPKEIL